MMERDRREKESGKGRRKESSKERGKEQEKMAGHPLIPALALCLLTAGLTAAVLAGYHSRQQFALLDSFCQRLIESRGVDSTELLLAVKEEQRRVPDWPEWPEGKGGGILGTFGYGPADFIPGGWSFDVWAALLCGGAGAVLSTLFLLWRDKAEQARIRALTGYLEKVHMGGPGLLVQGEYGKAADRPQVRAEAKTTAKGPRVYPSMAPVEEGEYGRLQDEIYKTVTSLYRTRDEALAAKEGYADNLQNIAHQLKTPITAISLAAQMLGGREGSQETGQVEQSQAWIQVQIQKQVARLTHLEEALLLLARIDAGVLSLKKQAVDVFTLLTLAADSLGPLTAREDIAVDIPEMGQVQILADMEWMMEAVMNLLKDCMEHSPAGGAIHCAYGDELLYVRIRIWDEGAGFHTEDLPYLFQRFYRGQDAPAGGIGIGLALSKELIEMQDGSLTAGNLPEGGAFFEIRMYSH